jgi:GR25 family glycosyltransferase involved in LPS biosynthesis
MILPFDKIYCLHLAEDKEKLNHLNKELEKLGIKNQVEIWWTCKKPISTIIGNSINTLKTLYYEKMKNYKPNVYAGVFNCAFEHYTIIKQSYLRGFDSILIIEDDITFIDDIKKIEEVFNSIPSNYDLIKYHSTEVAIIESSICINKYYYTNCFGVCSTKCYALSRKGMEKVIRYYESSFECADVVLNKLMYNYYNKNGEDYYEFKDSSFNYYIIDKECIVKDIELQSSIDCNELIIDRKTRLV